MFIQKKSTKIDLFNIIKRRFFATLARVNRHLCASKINGYEVTKNEKTKWIAKINEDRRNRFCTEVSDVKFEDVLNFLKEIAKLEIKVLEKKIIK